MNDNPFSATGPLVDTFGRVHTDLRISVTDRCNVRCHYCVPAEGIQYRPHAEMLTYEEIERFVRVVAGMGIRKIRLTGGEPLVRKGVCRLVEMLVAVPGIDQIAMTTNGILLDQYAEALKAAGLMRLNISLDTLDRDKFQQITRHDELPRVLEGIAAARRAGFEGTKLNALAIRGLSEDDVVPLARFARENRLELRFIEFMPVDGDRKWTGDRVLLGKEILELLSREIGPLEPVSSNGSTAAATQFRYVDGGGCVGVVRSVTEPFCGKCSRLRLTADGNVRNCLFSGQQWETRPLLRSGATDRELAELIRSAVGAKSQARGTDDGQFARCDRPMHQIGG